MAALNEKDFKLNENPPKKKKLQLIPAVQAHLDNKLDELRDLIKPNNILNLTFNGDRGATIIRATLKTDNFDQFSKDDRKLGGSCLFYAYNFSVWAFDDVDAMYSKMFHIIDLMNDIFIPRS